MCKRYASLLFLVLLGSSLCFAQTFGSITGTVTDASGALIPGATVTVTNTDTNTSRNGVSNASGLYRFPALNPGMYEVRAEVGGFRSAVRSGIELQVQQTARIDFALEVGQVTETVEVIAEAALLNTEDATVGTVIEERRIVDLPLNGRSYLQLVSLSPNVSYGFGTPGQAGGRQGGTRTSQNISVAGMRGVWNNYTLDGISNTDINFNLYILMPSPDALQEFKVQSGVYPAEFGRGATQINVSTKPGTNQFHGSAYWFHRNSAIDAKQYHFDGPVPEKTPFRWNQWGATVGGPIVRDRLFFMANFEGFNERESSTGTWSTPDAAARAGDLSGLPSSWVTEIIDPLTGIPFPNMQVPTSRFDPTGTAQKLLEFWPLPNGPGASHKYDRNYTQTTKDTVDKYQLTTRIDFYESAGSQWFGRYSMNDETSVTGGLPLSGRTLLTNAKQVTIANTRVISPTKVNEFRFGMNVLYNEVGNELGGVRNVVEELGLPLGTEPDSSWGIPTISVERFSGFGNNVNGPFVIDDNIYQFMDNFSWVIGNHSLRFGGEYRYDIYDQIGNEFPRGRYSHDGRYSGTGLADYLMGNLSRAEAALALAQADYSANNLGLYIDDVFRVSPQLTLNFGLRWEWFQPYYDRTETTVNSIMRSGLCDGFPCLSNIPNDPDQNFHPLAVRMGDGDFYEGRDFRYITNLTSIGGGSAVPINFARDSSLYGKRLINEDWNNFAPRFGVAFSPNENWSIRTGFGIFYSAESGNSRFDMNRGMGGRLDRAASSEGELPNTFWNNFLDPTQFPVKVQSAYLWGVVPDVGTSYSVMYLFNIQRSLGANSSIEIGYNGAQHRNTQGLQNQGAPIPGTSNILGRRPAPEYGFQQVVVGGNYGNYNGLGIKLSQRNFHGVTSSISYTWSKALDNSSAIRGTTSDITPQDNRCLDCEYGYSAYNTPHRFVSSILYAVPSGGTTGVLRQIVGGWELGTILTIQSGRPINTQAGWDAPGTATFGDPRINNNGQNPYKPSGQRTTEEWWNESAFYYVPGGTFGNVSRNRLIGPSSISWDFSVLKSFQITEGQRLQARFEAFNFPNHPRWGTPGRSWGRNPDQPNDSFGRIRGTSSMRQIQFGLKYVF